MTQAGPMRVSPGILGSYWEEVFLSWGLKLVGYKFEPAGSHLATKKGGVCLKVKQHGRKQQR